jgi:hypothetical protein
VERNAVFTTHLFSQFLLARNFVYIILPTHTMSPTTWLSIFQPKAHIF